MQYYLIPTHCCGKTSRIEKDAKRQNCPCHRHCPAQMSVEKVRHAQRECLSERVTWFACALVKEKVEMCAGNVEYMP